MIISYIEDKKKKRGHALPIGLVDRRINNAAVIGKVDIELREVREWCCVRERDFFAPIQAVLRCRRACLKGHE
jgi:hypothetical protein